MLCPYGCFGMDCMLMVVCLLWVRHRSWSEGSGVVSNGRVLFSCAQLGLGKEQADKALKAARTEVCFVSC